jgi:hypothetical protein
MLKVSASRVRNRRRGFNGPDLQTQYESLLDQVWRCEADWRLYDRIDAFCASEPDHCDSHADPERRGSK